MKTILKFTLFVFILVSLSGCKSLYFKFLVDIAPERFVFKVDDEVLKIPLFSSQPLDINNNENALLLIMIHGGGLTADRYFESGLRLSHDMNYKKNEIMIIAPQFLEKGVSHNERGLLFWDSKWRGGGNSLSINLNEQLPSVSSYEVLDKLIQAVIYKNPNIDKVIIFGHSAGGQFTMRYAAMNTLHVSLERQGVHLFYVVANPSSYLYLNEYRFKFNDEGKIIETSPGTYRECPTYNHYKYGLDNRYGYSVTISTDEINHNILSRPIMFLLGTADNKRDWGLNKSCEGDAQGSNRYERGLLYKHHLQSLSMDRESYRHIWLELAGVGHDSTEMFTNDYFITKLHGSYLDEISNTKP